MSIAPVNQVSLTRNINFTGTHKQKNKTGNTSSPNQHKSSMCPAFPLIISLFALTPNSVNASTAFNENRPKIELDDTLSTSSLIPEDNEYIEDDSIPAPYGYDCLKNKKIISTYKFESNNEKYTLLFTSKDSTNSVDNIYIIPEKEIGPENATYYQPFEIRELRFHNIGRKTEFCGAIAEHDVHDTKTGKYIGTFVCETKLPKTIALEILCIVSPKSPASNNTGIQITQTSFPNPLESGFLHKTSKN